MKLWEIRTLRKKKKVATDRGETNKQKEVHSILAASEEFHFETYKLHKRVKCYRPKVKKEICIFSLNSSAECNFNGH